MTLDERVLLERFFGEVGTMQLAIFEARRSSIKRRPDLGKAVLAFRSRCQSACGVVGRILCELYPDD